MTHIHLIGIGGTGLSAIARVLLEMGYTVSGSDRVESPFTLALQAAGASISIGHRAENIGDADVVVRSSAIPDDNPEAAAARLAGIPLLKRADFLGFLMDGKRGIAVAGTHGKTTTSAMIAWILTVLGQDPTFIVGGVLSNLGVNARAGKGQSFVIEADEYDRTFLGLKPSLEVVTNVEHDHPDCYPTPVDFQAAFVDFVHLLPENGTLVACRDDDGARDLLLEAGRIGRSAIGYGLAAPSAGSPAAGSSADKLVPNKKGGFTFSASILGSAVTVELQVPGQHNVLNALAALTITKLLDQPLTGAAQALSSFQGTGRRFEVRGEPNGILVIDDYAHHPTEIRATLSAARSRYPGRHLWAVWQPHTYTRTRTLFGDFAQAFGDADEVIVTEIYAAREAPEDFSSRQVAQAIQTPPAHFIAGLKDVSNYLVTHLHPGDALLVLSAGDADQVSTDVLARLKKEGAKA